MSKILALFPLLDLTSLIGTKDFSVLDLRSVNPVIDPEDISVENISAYLEDALHRDAYEIIVIDFDPEVLRHLSQEVKDNLIAVIPASSTPARIYLNTVLRHSNLSQATVTHFLQDYPKFLRAAQELREDFLWIELHGIKEILHVPGLYNRNISFAKELQNQRNGYRYVERKPTKKQRRLSEGREFQKLVSMSWANMQSLK